MIKFKTLTMSNCKYVLKAGVLLQAFSDASKTCTNANLTDELAEWHLEHNPGCHIYFAVLPGIPSVPDEVRDRPRTGGPTIIVPPEKEIPHIVEEFVKANTETTPPPPVRVVKKKKVVATKNKR
jgi:hypothetical protein